MPSFNLEHQYDEDDCYPRRIDEIYGSIRPRDLIGCPSWAPNLNVHADAAEYLDLTSWPTTSYGAASDSSSDRSAVRDPLSGSERRRSSLKFTAADVSYLAGEIFKNVQRGVKTDDADLDGFELMLEDQFVIRTRINPSRGMREIFENGAFWLPNAGVCLINALLLCGYPDQYQAAWDGQGNRIPSMVGILSWLCWFLTFTLSVLSLARSIWTSMDGDCVRRRSRMSTRMIWEAPYVVTDLFLLLISGFMLIVREVQML